MYNSIELGRLENICVLRKRYYEAVRSPVEDASVLGQHVPASIMAHLPLLPHKIWKHHTDGFGVKSTAHEETLESK